MRFWVLALAVSTCTGCTMLSLERHTLAQAGSVVDLRYREVLDNLARVAHDPSALPAYSSIFAGSAQVTDLGQVTSTTIWQHVTGMPVIQNGFGSEAANPQVSRTVLQNWTLDPIVVPEKIQAMRCACQWVLYGPERACSDCPGLLASPDQAPGPGRHFGVADRLARLPKGWLQVGRLKDLPLGGPTVTMSAGSFKMQVGRGKDVPLSACYKAHCGDTWVWVTPEGMAGLADFTLVLQDIARVESNSPTLFNLPPSPSGLRFEASPDDPSGNSNCTFAATVALDACGRLVPPQPYFQARIDNVGSPASLRSQINAAGGSR